LYLTIFILFGNRNNNNRVIEPQRRSSIQPGMQAESLPPGPNRSRLDGSRQRLELLRTKFLRSAALARLRMESFLLFALHCVQFANQCARFLAKMIAKASRK
jgi:hypothetical protein